MVKWFASILILMLFTAGAWAQAAPPSPTAPSTVKSSSGVVTFSLENAKPSVSVNLEGPMIRIAAAAAGEAGSPISDLLDQIKLVHVQVYEGLQQDATVVLNAASNKIVELKQQGWSSAVSVPNKGESVDVLTRTSEDAILGLVVLVAEKNEIVFVNLAGEIDPEGLGKMIGKFKEAILDGNLVDFQEALFPDEGDDDDDEDEDELGEMVKEKIKEKMKNKDKDGEKEQTPQAESQSAPQAAPETAP